MWRRVAYAVLFCSAAGWVHAQPASDARFSQVEQTQVQQILESGAPDLALRQIELAQPTPAQPTPERAEEWAAWERLRFTAYQKSGNHRALLDRLQVVPAFLLPATALPLRVHAVELLLDAGVKADYEILLRSLIWHPGADAAGGAGSCRHAPVPGPAALHGSWAHTRNRALPDGRARRRSPGIRVGSAHGWPVGLVRRPKSGR